MAVACAVLKFLKYKSEETFTFVSYATQMMGHFETLERGRQGKFEVEKVTQLLDQTNNDHAQLLVLIELVSNNDSFKDAIT